MGLVHAPGLVPLLEETEANLDLLEIEPQTSWRYLPWEEQPYQMDPGWLRALEGAPQRKLVHSVGFPVGGSRAPEPKGIQLVVDVIEHLDAPWASEHLAFNRCSGVEGEFLTGFLLPPLQTPEGVDAAVESIRTVAKRIPVPFLIETGVNYLQPQSWEVPDGDFVAAVVESADCGILLDLHNLWANERNGRQSVATFLSTIPLDRVVEVHLAGGTEREGYWLDAHSDVIPRPLFNLAAEVIPTLPELRAVVFEILPAFAMRLGGRRLQTQMEELRRLWEGRGKRPVSGWHYHEPVPSPRIERKRPASPEEWEAALGALVVGREPRGALAESLAEDPGVSLYQKLIWKFRAGMVVDNMRLTCRLITLYGGERLLRELLGAFFARRPPELFGSAEADAFARYLQETGTHLQFIEDLARFEAAALRVHLTGQSQVVPFRHEPETLLEAVTQGRLPKACREGQYEVEVASSGESGLFPQGGVLSPT